MNINLNKNISVWRGNNTPPTDYHLWVKDDGSILVKVQNQAGQDEWVSETGPYLDSSIKITTVTSLEEALQWLSTQSTIIPQPGTIIKFQENDKWVEYISIGKNYQSTDNWEIIGQQNVTVELQEQIDALQIVQIEPTDNEILTSYQLQDKNNTVHGVTINIPKDKSIKDVQVLDTNATIDDEGNLSAGDPVGTTALCIVYITQDGSYKLVKLDYSKFIEETEYGNGLTVQDHIISIKLNTNPQTSKYIDLDQNGLGIKGIDEEIEEHTTNITSDQISDGAITTNKIASGAVTNEKLATSSVTTGKINNNAITTDKLANNSVSTDKVIDGAITANKLADSVIKLNELPGEDETSIKTYELRINNIDQTLIGKIDIPKDQHLVDVKVSDTNATLDGSGLIVDGNPKGTTALVLSYYLEDGTYKIAKLDYQRFIEEAEIGNGLDIVDGKVVIKLDSSVQTSKYLQVTDSGLGVKGIDEAINQSLMGTAVKPNTFASGDLDTLTRMGMYVLTSDILSDYTNFPPVPTGYTPYYPVLYVYNSGGIVSQTISVNHGDNKLYNYCRNNQSGTFGDWIGGPINPKGSILNPKTLDFYTADLDDVWEEGVYRNSSDDTGYLVVFNGYGSSNSEQFGTQIVLGNYGNKIRYRTPAGITDWINLETSEVPKSAAGTYLVDDLKASGTYYITTSFGLDEFPDTFTTESHDTFNPSANFGSCIIQVLNRGDSNNIRQIIDLLSEGSDSEYQPLKHKYTRLYRVWNGSTWSACHIAPVADQFASSNNGGYMSKEHYTALNNSLTINSTGLVKNNSTALTGEENKAIFEQLSGDLRLMASGKIQDQGTNHEWVTYILFGKTTDVFDISGIMFMHRASGEFWAKPYNIAFSVGCAYNDTINSGIDGTFSVLSYGRYFNNDTVKSYVDDIKLCTVTYEGDTWVAMYLPPQQGGNIRVYGCKPVTAEGYNWSGMKIVGTETETVTEIEDIYTGDFIIDRAAKLLPTATTENKGLLSSEDKIAVDSIAYKRYTLNLTDLDSSIFYPVVLTPNQMVLSIDCEINSQSTIGTDPYNLNRVKFSLTSKGAYDEKNTFTLWNAYNFDDNEITIGSIGHTTKGRGGTGVVFLRGSKNYYIITNATPTLHTESYTNTDVSNSPWTVAPGSAITGGTNSAIEFYWKNDRTRNTNEYINAKYGDIPLGFKTLYSANLNSSAEDNDECWLLLGKLTDSFEINGILFIQRSIGGYPQQGSIFITAGRSYATDSGGVIGSYHIINTSQWDDNNYLNCKIEVITYNEEDYLAFHIPHSLPGYNLRLYGVETHTTWSGISLIRLGTSPTIVRVVSDRDNVFNTLGVDKSDLTYLVGNNTVTTLESTPVTKKLVVANLTESQILSLASNLPAGHELHIILNNNSDASITVTLPYNT